MTTPGWLADDRTPEEQLTDLREKVREWADYYIEADLQARDAGRRRMRSLDRMRELRHQMAQLAADNGLEMPQLRWGYLLEDDDNAT